MISPVEQDYLHWLTAERWKGGGDVIEVGPWLGGSTWCLASGMEANPRREPSSRLHVVDNFRWQPFMAQRAPLRLLPGESFRAQFERNLEPKSELIIIHEARLPDDDSARAVLGDAIQRFDDDLALFSTRGFDRPLDVVFVDGAKSWSGLRHLLLELVPCLDRNALLVLQDFKDWMSYWIPLGIGFILDVSAESMRLEHVLPLNTVAFEIGSGFGSAVESMPESLNDIGTDDGRRLLSIAASALAAHGDEAGAQIVGLAESVFLGTRGDWEAALHTYRRVERAWPRGTEPLAQVWRTRAWLKERSGRAVGPSTRARLLQADLAARRQLRRARGLSWHHR